MREAGQRDKRKRSGWPIDRALLLALLSGGLFVLLFPHFSCWPLSFFALVPLLVAIEGKGARRSFGLGWFMGLVYFAGSLSWIEYTLVRFGGMPQFLAYPVLLLLAAYLAFYPALTCLALYRTRNSSWPLPLRLAIFWVATEALRGYLLTGFPWNLLGHSLHQQLDLLQMADLGGVYGLSFFLALLNGLLYAVVRGSDRRHRLQMSILFVLLLGTAWAYGRLRLGEALPPGTVRVALIQHNAPQDHKWDAKFRKQIVDSLLELSASTIAQEPELIVWSEGSTPFRFRHNPLFRKLIGDFVSMAQIPLLLGAPDEDPQRDRHYNSAFLLDKTGDIVGQYSKMQLVPFGEYVPLEPILFFVEKLAAVGGNFYPGEAYTVFSLRELKFSTFICFESVFGEIVRQFARRGAQFLITITNDAWFGDSAGTSQHLSFLPFRAVETRRPVAQAAQSGFTAAYDQYGRLLGKSRLLVKETLVVDLHPAAPETWTLYMLFGNWIAFICWGLSVQVLWACARQTRNSG